MNVSRSLLALVLGALLAGCSGINSPSNNANETFSGTVTPETGATTAPITHGFTVDKSGEMSVRVTAITPNNATLIGLALGQQISGGCPLITRSDLSGLNRDVLVYPIYQKGGYCIQVYNGGGVSASQNYTIQVNHP